MDDRYRSLHLVSADLLPLIDQIAQRDPDQPLADKRRERLAAAVAACRPHPEVDRSEFFIPGAGGDLRIIVYVPRNRDGESAGLLHIHGGGFVVGAPEYEDERNSQIAGHLGHVVVSVDYRLAPEATYPAALDDCHAALVWLRDNAAELRVDTARLGLIGESAGGCHAAALALMARDRGDVPLAFMWLVYPMIDDRTGSTMMPHAFAGEFAWTAEANRAGWRAMLGQEPGGTPPGPYAVPARCEDLSGLPPTLMQTGSLDLFCDENLEFARGLMRAGVACEVHVYPGAIHGFPKIASSAAAVALQRDGFAALCRALG